MGERHLPLPHFRVRPRRAVVGRPRPPGEGLYPCVVSMADGTGREDARRDDGSGDRNRSVAGDHDRAGGGGTRDGDRRDTGSRAGRGTWSGGGAQGGGRSERPPWRDRNDDSRGGSRPDRGDRPARSGDDRGARGSSGYDRRGDGPRGRSNSAGG